MTTTSLVASHLAWTRVVNREGVTFTEGRIVPMDAVDDSLEWDSASLRAVDSWEAELRPADSLQTEDERVGQLLRELGWEVVGSQRGGAGPGRRTTGLPVRRIEARFHTATVVDDGEASVLIMNLEGEIIDSISSDDQLSMHGWRNHGRAPGWSSSTESLSALDWGQILHRLNANRRHAQAATKEADRRLRLAIREALSAGIPVATIVEETGLTRQRVYQIRGPHAGKK